MSYNRHIVVGLSNALYVLDTKELWNSWARFSKLNSFEKEESSDLIQQKTMRNIVPQNEKIIIFLSPFFYSRLARGSSVCTVPYLVPILCNPDFHNIYVGTKYRYVRTLYSIRCEHVDVTRLFVINFVANRIF